MVDIDQKAESAGSAPLPEPGTKNSAAAAWNVQPENATVDVDVLDHEYRVFQSLLKAWRAEAKNGLSLKEVCSRLISNPTLRLLLNGAIIPLAEITLCLPVHTADCERGFSIMNLILTALRSRMSTRTLCYCMMIMIEGPALEDFDFDRAVDLFRDVANRRAKL